MKKFLVLAEVTMDEKKYNNLIHDGFEPTDFINSVIADHARDRDLNMKIRCVETDYYLLDDVCKAADAIAHDKAFDELEEAVLKNNMCIGGNCEA